MRILKNIVIAFRALKSNTLRSLLTMLGIIIGVAAVITMVAVGEGAHYRVAEQIRSLGTNLLMVQPQASATTGVQPALTEADATAIGNEILNVIAASPSVRDIVLVNSGTKKWQTLLTGTGPEYFFVRDWRIVNGRGFTSAEVENAAKVAVIGSSIAQGFFADTDPIGKVIRVADVPVRVKGVLAEKGASGSGRDQDDVLFVPISTAKLRLIGSPHETRRDTVAYILVKVTEASKMEDSQSQIAALLRQRHRLQPHEANDFRISDPAATMAAQRGASRTLTFLLLAVASVSLVVGGISIMNIMLVSVTERTREIGLRLAVGARRSDILNQFITEAITLCALGGLFGVLFGICAAILIGKIAGWPIFIGLSTILLSFGFAALVGVFFGFYPALKAARLNPIDALRFE